MTAFWMAWGMFWIVPCPVKKWNPEKKKEMLLCMPLIGLLIGLLWFGAAVLSGFSDNRGVAAGILSVFPWLLTGFIHLDGLMDCADAVLSRRDLAERRRILKDSHTGSFAVIAMVLTAICSFASFSDMGMEKERLAILCFLPAVSRCLSALCLFSVRPMAGSSYEKMHEKEIPSRYRFLLILAVSFLTATAFLLCGKYGWAIIAELLSFFAVSSYLIRDLEGMSGDISGCAITLCEVCALLVLSLLPG